MRERFVQIRKKMGFSQQQMADLLGISRATLAYIESGKRQPSAEVLRSMVIGSGVSARWLLTGEPDRDINAGGFIAYNGDMTVSIDAGHGPEPFTITGGWIYDPRDDLWYNSSGCVFPATMCKRG